MKAAVSLQLFVAAPTLWMASQPHGVEAFQLPYPARLEDSKLRSQKRRIGSRINLMETQYDRHNKDSLPANTQLAANRIEEDNAIRLSKMETAVLSANNNEEEAALLPSPQNSNTAETYANIEDDRSFVLYDLSRAALLGLICGIFVACFKEFNATLRLESYSFPFLVNPYINALVPAAGGLVVGLLALLQPPFSPGLKGVIEDMDKDSKYNPVPFFRKTLAASATLGTGNSLGPEGPSVEIGVNLSRILSTNLGKIPDASESEMIKHNRLLLSCGGAAGVAAGFNAPIAGIFFALEVIQGTISRAAKKNREKNKANGSDTVNTEYGDLISTKGGISSVVLSSVISALVCKELLGDELVFKVSSYALKTPLLELPLYLMLGTLCGVLAFLFSQLANISKSVFKGQAGPGPLRDVMTALPAPTKPVLGGLFCGFVGIYYPQILFFGYETLNNLLAKTSLSTELLLTLLGLKMVTTAVAAGSGLVGGTFAPSLFFGGMLGASFHNILSQQIGTGLADVPAYAMIGSASVLAALFRAPLTASLLLFECTREYDIILPLMASAGLGSVVADTLEVWAKGGGEIEKKYRDEDSVSWGDLSSDDAFRNSTDAAVVEHVVSPEIVRKRY